MNANGISLIIPAYNAGRYLREAIDSALGQTVPPSQIIVVDDGSTDDTFAIAQSYREKVTAITQPNAGAATARNRALTLATEPFIAFLDADDRMVKHKLERQLGVLADHPDAQICMARVRDFWSPEIADAAAKSKGLTAQRRPGQMSAWLSRREVFDTVGHFNTTAAFRFSEGSELYSRIEHAGMKFVEIDEVLIERRLHDSNMTTNSKAHMDGIMALMKRRIDLKKGAK